MGRDDAGVKKGCDHHGVMYKKGDRSNCNNYCTFRGISLLSKKGNVLAKTITSRLSAFCEANDILPEKKVRVTTRPIHGGPERGSCNYVVHLKGRGGSRGGETNGPSKADGVSCAVCPRCRRAWCRSLRTDWRGW